MTAQEYEANISDIVSLIKSHNSSAKVILIAPWYSDDIYDKLCRVNVIEKKKLYYEYNKVLKNISKKQDCIYVNPNPFIWERISENYLSKYLTDWIHPNASEGIRLFAEAFVSELSKVER